jgi:hypothetical protein
VSNELVQNVLKRKRRRMKVMFEFYASKDDSDGAVHHFDTINIGECVLMCRELALNIPDRIISRLFASVQGDEDDGNDETSMLEEKGELTYTEFSEFMGALSAWTRPGTKCISFFFFVSLIFILTVSTSLPSSLRVPVLLPLFDTRSLRCFGKKNERVSELDVENF